MPTTISCRNTATRGVYFEGLCELINIDGQARDLDYLTRWANAHKFTPRNGVTTRDADDYCCSQAYLFLYEHTFQNTGKRAPEMLLPTRQCMDNLLNPVPVAKNSKWTANSMEDWTWLCRARLEDV